MSKVLQSLLIGVLLVSLTGCVTVKKVVRERVDQDISGNRGFIQGRSTAPKKAKATTREYVDVKVELPMWEEVEQNLPKAKPKPKRPAKDKGAAGNRGYISSGRGFEEELPPVYRPKPAALVPTKPTVYEYEEEEAGILPAEEVMAEPATYKVKKGDTLSQIAKDFYGKASKWTVIYEANADRIKDPNKVKAGTVLVIPELEEAESGYVK